MVNLAIRGSNYRYGYTKVDKEDQEEKSHREAQFLIYKTMKQVDQMVMSSRRSSKKTSWLKLRICKLKVRIGNKLLSLRKTMLCNMSKTLKVGVFRHLKSFKRLFNGGGDGGGGSGGSCGGRRDGHGGGSLTINHLPPPLII